MSISTLTPMSPCLRTVLAVATIVVTLSGTAAARMAIDVDSKSDLDGQPRQILNVSEAPLQDWPRMAATHETNLLLAIHGAFGIFGYGFTDNLGYATAWDSSFNVLAESRAMYLFAGSIWMGGVVNGDTLVSTGHDGWWGITEMYPPDMPEPAMTRIEPAFGDEAFRTEFVDTNTTLGGTDPEDGNRPHIPLGLKMANRSFVRNGPVDGRIVLYDLVISNIGPDLVEDAYIGFYFDGDVTSDYGTGFDDDLTGFLGDSSIAYIIDDDGEFDQTNFSTVTKSFCFRALVSSMPMADTAYNWWISNGSPSVDFGPRHQGSPDFPSGGTGTPVTDFFKYYILSNGEYDYDQIFTASIDSTDTLWEYPYQNIAYDFSDGFDTRFLMSYGPFDLAPGESERILYSTFSSGEVHTDPYNAYNLNSDPDAYLAGLDFSSVYETGAAAKQFATEILDPAYPPVGLQVANSSSTSIEVEWDPYVFPEVTGYSVAVGEITPGELNHPGVIQPWLNPGSYLQEVIVGPDVHSYLFDNLTPGSLYFVKVAHITAEGTHAYSHPIYHRTGDRMAAPQFEHEFTFFLQSEFLNLEWTPPEGEVDHYNIYRFDDTLSKIQFYHAFYDSGAAAGSIPFDEQIIIGSDTFYFYEPTPWAVVDGSQSSYPDLSPVEGTYYKVTAVEPDGFESDFSTYIEAVGKPDRSHDVLVVTHGHSSSGGLMNWDSVSAFYERTLDGFDYAIFNWLDTVIASDPSGIGRVDWHHFMEYELILIDDDIREVILNSAYENATNGFTKAILSGTDVAYFGSFATFPSKLELISSPGFYEKSDPFLDRFFPFDSIYQVGAGYFHLSGLPKVDTLFGFRGALAADTSFHNVTYDTGAARTSDFAQLIWPPTTPPSVSVFTGVDPQYVTHYADAPDSIDSPLDDMPVGWKVESAVGSEISVFGFHLWYMHSSEARGLIFDLLDRNCCQNRGNANGRLDGTEYVSIADLTFLVDHVFRGGPGSPCPEEADANADGALNITDLVFLIDFLFRGGTAPSPCL